MQNALGVAFIMKEMVKHLANLLFANPGPLKVCHHCDHDKYPNGKPIFNDFAVPDKNGNYKCDTCVKRDYETGILLLAPNSPAARDTF